MYWAPAGSGDISPRGGRKPQNIRDIRYVYVFIVLLQRVSLSRMRF